MSQIINAKIFLVINDLWYLVMSLISVISEKHLCHLCLKKIRKDKPPELLARMEMEILFFCQGSGWQKKKIAMDSRTDLSKKRKPFCSKKNP